MEGEGQPDVAPPLEYNPYADDRLSIEIDTPAERRASYHPDLAPAYKGNVEPERPRSQSFHPAIGKAPNASPHRNSELAAQDNSRQRASSRSPEIEENYAFNNYKANSKHKSQYSDDAGSMQEDNSEKRYGKHEERHSLSNEFVEGNKRRGSKQKAKERYNLSVVSLDREAAREVFRDEYSTYAPTEGVKVLCALVCIILACVLAGLCAPTSGILVTVGVFGNVETVRWEYGYVGKKIDRGVYDTYKDNYTRQVATDVGGFFLLGLLGSLFVSVMAFYILSTRYSSNLPLYVTCCSIRIPQRQTLSVLYGLMKGVFWITTMWYLVVCFHGLLEMNYYINNNCTSGTCYTYIIPSYGWIAQIVIVLIMSCCLYVRLRKLDPPIQPKTMKFYYPEHEKIAESERAPINLLTVLDLQDTARKILLYATVCWFMQRSGFITIANLEKNHGTNIVGVFIPIGWYNVKWSDAIDTSKNGNISAAGEILGTVCAFVAWSGLACLLYLLHVVVKFRSGKVRRTLFLVLCSLMTLLWLFGGGLFYYRFYVYWNDGGKSAVPPPDTGVPDGSTGSPVNTFWFPSWGFIFWALNIYYLLKLLIKSWTAL